MQTKLTLRLEDELINKAKKISNQKGKSLSKLVSDYFAFLISKEEEKDDIKLTPTVKSIYGILENTNIDESKYKKHLEKKYL